MSFAATGAALIGGGLGLGAAWLSSQGAQNAATTQANAAQAGINAQNEQFAAIQKMLAPYVSSGTNALSAQNDLLGLNGDDAQQQALSGISSSSQFQSLNKAGSDAILANAAATGGLRGGNTQGALASNSSNILNNLIQQRFSNLGSLSSLGQNAASGVANAGSNTANQVSSLLQQQGAATAGGQMSSGNLFSNALGNGVGLTSYLNQLFSGTSKGNGGTNN